MILSTIQLLGYPQNIISQLFKGPQLSWQAGFQAVFTFCWGPRLEESIGRAIGVELGLEILGPTFEQAIWPILDTEDLKFFNFRNSSFPPIFFKIFFSNSIPRYEMPGFLFVLVPNSAVHRIV